MTTEKLIITTVDGKEHAFDHFESNKGFKDAAGKSNNNLFDFSTLTFQSSDGNDYFFNLNHVISVVVVPPGPQNAF